MGTGDLYWTVQYCAELLIGRISANQSEPIVNRTLYPYMYNLPLAIYSISKVTVHRPRYVPANFNGRGKEGGKMYQTTAAAGRARKRIHTYHARPSIHVGYVENASLSCVSKFHPTIRLEPTPPRCRLKPLCRSYTPPFGLNTSSSYSKGGPPPR